MTHPAAAVLSKRGFDNDFFGIDIEEAQAISPSQRWVMEVGYEARRFGLRRGLRNWEANVCFFLGGNSWLKFLFFCLLERLVKWNGGDEIDAGMLII